MARLHRHRAQQIGCHRYVKTADIFLLAVACWRKEAMLKALPVLGGGGGGRGGASSSSSYSRIRSAGAILIKPS
jgi:hypothetical protein